ncbi:unannotated protein [freshwater metagenome]|uniref:Unannotated protein n=1 Tax=freshwater metagenome TaxID=449393 RepID=A0A6J7J941_9ZZZZ
MRDVDGRRAAYEPGHRGEGDGHRGPRQLLDRSTEAYVDLAPVREVGQALGEEDQPLSREPQRAQQRLVEDEDDRQVRVGREGGVAVAERLGGEPHGLRLPGAYAGLRTRAGSTVLRDR